MFQSNFMISMIVQREIFQGVIIFEHIKIVYIKGNIECEFLCLVYVFA